MTRIERSGRPDAIPEKPVKRIAKTQPTHNQRREPILDSVEIRPASTELMELNNQLAALESLPDGMEKSYKIGDLLAKIHDLEHPKK